MAWQNFKPIKNINGYQIKGDQAYNQEGILIYNILAYTKVSEIRFEEILKYFQSFSKKHIKVSLWKKRNYLIEFKDSKDAAKVLKKSEHIICNHLIYVEPSSSWLQPHIKNLVKYIDQLTNKPNLLNEIYTFEDPNYLNKSEHHNCFITKLNDDCLMEIFNKLHLKDQINFALCCPRFCDIFQTISCAKYSNLDMEILKALTELEIKIFGLIVGPYIKILKYYIFKFSQLFCVFCPNIETLKIDCDTWENLIFLQVHMPRIHRLQLMTFSSNLIKYLKNFKYLKYLHFTSYEWTGEYLSSFVKLEELSLNECYSLLPKHFQEICKNLKNLKYLDIRYCNNLGTNDFEHIVENLLQLETLKLGNATQNFNCICRLPKLKVLEINSSGNRKIIDNFFQDIVKHQANRLQELKFNKISVTFPQIELIAELKNLKVFHCCYNNKLNDKGLEQISKLIKLQDIDLNNCCNISNQGILKLLESCLELKKLNIAECELLTSDLVWEIRSILQKQYDQNKRTHQLHLEIADIELFRYVVDELGLRMANHVLKITLIQNEYYNYDNLLYRRLPSESDYSCTLFSDRFRNSDAFERSMHNIVLL